MLELQEQLRRRWALVLCFLTAVFEGLDLQSMGVAAPGVAAEFGLPPAMMGVIGSASSLGLLFGALLGGVLSDRVGRRPVLMWAVGLFGVFSILTPAASEPVSLIVVRFLTGLGLGGGLPMIIAVAAEAVTPERRGQAVTMMYCSTPIGGIIASIVAYLVGSEWRWIFYVGGIAPLLLLPLMYLRLRDTEAVRGAVSAGERIGVWTALFGQGRAAATLLMWIAFFGSVLVLYLLLNWLPLLLVGKGFSRGDANIAQIWLNLGGATGALVLGTLVGQRNRRAVLAVTYVVGAFSLAALAAIGSDLTLVSAAAFVAGLYSQGVVFVLYGLAATYYRTIMRGTGVGWAVAMGRLGSVAGPILAGVLVASGQSPGQVLLGILPIVIVTALVVQALLFFRPAND